MSENALKTHIENGTGWIVLNRPDVHNAFDDLLIAELKAAFDAMAADGDVQVVVLRAEGKSFSAGADLNWMKRMAGYSQAENEEDSRKLADMLRALDRMPKPVVGLIQGAAFGGGVGLVAACDIAVCAEEATFTLSEVKLGIIPAVISPYVIAAMGARQARRFFLTGEKFGADTARRIGLVHKVVPSGELETEGKRIVQSLLKNGPLAMAEAKDLIFAVADRPLDDEMVEDTARRIARIRASEEGREGIAAFLEKRKPEWSKG